MVKNESEGAIGKDIDVTEEQPAFSITDTKESGEITVDNGVLAPASNRKITGRWLPGQSGNPSGRPRRPETAVLRYMNEKIPAEKIVATVLELIEDTSSWRAREAGVKLYLSYMVGMPVQRSVTATTKLESLLSRVSEMSEEEFAEVEQAMKRSE